MNSELVNFIKRFYVDDMYFSHQTLFEPKGKFRFVRNNLEKFEELYLKLAKDPVNNILGVAEKPREHIPVYADFDIKIKLTDDFTFCDTLYSEKNVLDVIKIFQSVIRQVLNNCSEKDLLCVLLEKPISKMVRNADGKDIIYYKRGFHIHFPYFFLKKSDVELHIYMRVQKILKEMNVFENLNVKDSSTLMDYKVIDNAWLMYGSRKEAEKDPYLISKVYDGNCEEINAKDAFNGYQIFNTDEELVTINEKNWLYYLPSILSIIPHHRKIHDIKSNLISPIREDIINKFVGDNKKKKQHKVSTMENIKMAKKLVPMLAQFRCENYHDWMEIGWVLYNVTDGDDEGLELWNEFSERCPEQYEGEDKLHLEWSKMKKRDYTIGTLKYFASVDSPEEYAKFKNDEGQKCIKDSIQGSHFDIAKYLHNEFGTEFVCASIVNKEWYQFINHRWEQVEEGVFLRQQISTEVVNKFSKYGSSLFQEQAECDKADEKSVGEKIKQTQKTITNLKSAPFKSNVMKEAADLFYDKNFLRKLDMNPYIIGFKNGVYDLTKNVFRPGKPEDYISKQMNISYFEYDDTDPRVEEVYNFLEKVFPDKSVRQYFMDQVSDVFVGGNSQKVVNFWTGNGDNAKSITQQIIEQMLGPYAIKFSTTLLTGKKLSNGVANPELARAGGGVRWAVLEEPDNDEELNIGYLKSLSGDDSIFVRDLFEKGKSTKEIQPMFKLVFICLSGNTKVSLSNGVSFSIKNLIKNKSKLLGWDSNQDGFININQNAFLDKGIQQCVSLTLLDGRKITCTPNHKFLTSDNEWIEAQDIKPNNTKLKMGIDYPVADDMFDSYNYELNLSNKVFDMRKLDDRIILATYSRILGFSLTDGSNNKILYLGHKIDCENLLNDIEFLSGRRPMIVENNNIFQIHLPTSIHNILQELCCLSKGRRINNSSEFPTFIYDEKCPKFIIREFIAGLFGGDGIIPCIVNNNFNDIRLVGSKVSHHIESLKQEYENLGFLMNKLFDIDFNVTTQVYKDDENKSYIFLNITKNHSIHKFIQQIGVRYCCHKSYRMMIVSSYFRYRNNIIQQNQQIINRTRELYQNYQKQNPKPLLQQIDKKTNEVIKTFRSSMDVEKELGFNHSSIRGAALRNGSSNNYKWKYIEQKSEIVDGNVCETLMNSRLKAIEELKDKIVDERYLITYTQVRRYINENIEYDMPSIDIKKYLIENKMFQFCNQGNGKGNVNYSVSRDRDSLPCYEMKIIKIEKVEEQNVYDINVDEPYSNFIAEGIVTHNCNKNPRIKNADEATFNRIRVLPFESKFVRRGESVPETFEEQLRQKKFPRDDNFKKKIPELLEPFCYMLLEHRKALGTNTRYVPDKVKAATLIYQKQNDRLRQFVEERLKEDRESYLHVDELYNEFKTWYRDSFSGQVPDKNEIKEHFIKKWGDLDNTYRWKGFRIKGLNDINSDEIAHIDYFSESKTKTEETTPNDDGYESEFIIYDEDEEQPHHNGVVINNGTKPIM
jgi:phage/plasmid-associated DNA primase